MSIERKHFHTFDALRFFSFLLVFLIHIPGTESSKIIYFTKSGGVGVSFFFTLSGFLITYILLHEKINKGKIRLKNFFVRRILRIWPLFYAMILFAFLTPYILNILKISYSDEGYSPNWFMSLFFLENYKMMITGTFPNVSPLRVMWSLCVEEHFYIIWGIIFFFIPAKKTPLLILLCILIANIFRIIYGYFNIQSSDLFSNIDYFAYGAIPAYILIFKSEIIDRIEKFPIFIKYLTGIITIALIFGLPNINSDWLPYLSPTIFGIFFSIIILFTLPPSNSIYIKDNFLISKLGLYTYGLYLFHTIILRLMLQITHLLNFEINWFVSALISLTITIIVSIISYHLFEKQFLKLKKFFY